MTDRSTITEREQALIDDFEMFDDWMDKYAYIIDLGKNLPLIDPALKDDDHLIRGCQSQVWLDAEERDGRIYYSADSDAVITKGIISLLIMVLSDQPAESIAKSEIQFIDKIGLREHLSPTRSNGLVSMVKQMKYYALALAQRN